MLAIIYTIFCGICWAWRGWDTPGFIKGYARAFFTAFMIIGLYCLWFTKISVFTPYPFLAVITLTLLESLLGYGHTCEDIDCLTEFEMDNAHNTLYPIANVPKLVKESYGYLGFVGMSYYLFPYMLLHGDKNILYFMLVAIIGYAIFPINKYLQLKHYNQIAENYNLDSWKFVEFFVGTGFGLLLIGGLK